MSTNQQAGKECRFGSGGKESSRDLAVTKRVVEEVHPAAAGHLQQQLFNQRVVPRLHLQPNHMCLSVNVC